jgi:hypothetical protein
MIRMRAEIRAVELLPEMAAEQRERLLAPNA